MNKITGNVWNIWKSFLCPNYEYCFCIPKIPYNYIQWRLFPKINALYYNKKHQYLSLVFVSSVNLVSLLLQIKHSAQMSVVITKQIAECTCQIVSTLKLIILILSIKNYIPKSSYRLLWISYIFLCLKEFGFTVYFSKWLKIIHANIQKNKTFLIERDSEVVKNCIHQYFSSKVQRKL